MHVPLPDLDGAAAVSRRAFLGCCSALLAAASGCATLAPRTRSAYALITDPALADYQPILDALIESVLPGPATGFPVAPREVRARLLHLFPLDTDPQFLGFQKAVMIFDQTDLFAQPLGPRQPEAIAVDASARHLDAASVGDHAHRQDVALYARFLRSGPARRFTSIPLDRRREYLDLWRASGYVLRRQFYASARSLVMITTYSMDAAWRALDYGGPLVDGRRR